MRLRSSRLSLSSSTLFNLRPSLSLFCSSLFRSSLFRSSLSQSPSCSSLRSACGHMVAGRPVRPRA